MKKSRLLNEATLALGVVLASAGTANAQAGDEVEAVSDVRVIDTVVVTARKTEESSQDVPIALTVFSGDAVKTSNIFAIEDLGRFTPGLAIGQSDQSRTRVVMRGVGSQKFDVGSDPSVGIFVDEVYIPRFSGQEFNLLDVGRIEVLKGPQGALFGRNTPGGAISVISPDPTDEVSGFVEAGLADRDGYSLAGALSGPIGERLRGSFSIGQEFRGGYAENTATGTTDDETSTAARGKLVFDATDTLTISGTVQITDLEAESINASSAPTLPGGQTIPLLGFPPNTPIDASPDPYDSPLNEDGFVELSSVLSILRIDKEFDNFTITSLTSYQDREAEQLGDFDRTDTNVALTTFDEDSQTFSQEFRFASDNFLGGKFVGGVFYYLDEAYRDDGFNWQSASLPFALNMGNPVQDNTIVDIETESLAVFGLYTYDFTDRLRLSAGGRYTDETKEFTMMGRTDLPMAPAVIENYDYSDDLSFDKFDPKVSVEYDLQDNVMLFASYTEGFKSGGVQFSAGSQALAELTFEPEEVDAFELGVKSDLLGGALRLNTSAFLYDYTDLQQQRVEVINGAPAAVTRNAAEAEIKGLEIDATYAATDALLLRVAYNYLDATYEDFDVEGPDDFTGNTMQNSPEHTLSATIDYRKTLRNDWTIGAGTDWFYTDSQFFDFTNDDPVTEEDAYTVGQVRLSLTSPDDRLVFTLYGENITDEEYRTAVFRRATEVLENWADGVRYGARVRLNF